MDFKNNITRALFKTLDKVERTSLPELCKLTLLMPSCRTKYSNFYGCNRKISFTVFCNLFICQRRKSNLLLHFNSSAQREAFFTLFPAWSTVLSFCRPQIKIIVVSVFPPCPPAHSAIDFSALFLLVTNLNYCMLDMYVTFLIIPTDFLLPLSGKFI